MRITLIQTRQIGSSFLVPKTDFIATIYPALIRFRSLINHQTYEFHFSIVGPVAKFSVTLDQKKGVIETVMHTQTGYFSSIITAKNQSVIIRCPKVPFGLNMNHQIVEANTIYSLFDAEVQKKEIKTQVFLGSMANKDSCRVKEDLDIKTLLPWFFALTMNLPKSEKIAAFDPHYQTLLQNKLTFEKGVKIIFQAFIKDFFEISKKDLTLQNLPDLFMESPSPLEMLAALKKEWIKALIDTDQNCIKILSNCPKNFHQGKICDLDLDDKIISIAWSRGKIREFSILSKKPQSLEIQFPRGIKTCQDDKGNILILDQSKLTISIDSNQKLNFKNFNK